MKVLLLTTDLYRSIGGGQTVYGKIIESSPGIAFHYILVNERLDAKRPANAIGVPLAAWRDIEVISHPPFPSYKRDALIDADRYARSVAGQSFDIVDIPDYQTCGGLLRDAFEVHGVSAKRIVLAMHGNISRSNEMNWDSGKRNVLELTMLEREQFNDADGIYAISPRYIREWQAIIKRHVHYIDPIHFVSAFRDSTVPGDRGIAKPSLYCIGRSERRKGNDLFVELVRWLPRGSYAEAAHIGDQDYSLAGTGSASLLQGIARKRGIDVAYRPALDRRGLESLFRQRSLIVLPVRYDTLNLIALEALFSGCPVAISSKAGVCDYLDETYPDLPYVRMDYDNLYGALPELQALLADYDGFRARLATFLARLPQPIGGPADIAAVYGKILAEPPRNVGVQPATAAVASQIRAMADASARLPAGDGSRPQGARLNRHQAVIYGKPRLSFRRQVYFGMLAIASRMMGEQKVRRINAFARSPLSFAKNVIKKRIKSSGFIDESRFISDLTDARRLPGRLRHIARSRESSLIDMREKLDRIYDAASNPLFRCNFWMEIARIERVLGHELIAVAYELRILRLLGVDRLGLLTLTAETLRKHGMPREAEAAEAMYGDPSAAPDRVIAFLNQTYQRHLHWQTKPFEHIDDRRSGTAKVAVIVSLYKAAGKMPFFLTAMRQQTLVRERLVEFVFIDSGSPQAERAVFEQSVAEFPLNAVYARSASRETIQAAWNRGIGLARAPYLVFLGVDECLYPEALEVLAAQLDIHPVTDWVMANSLVTAVEANGVYQNDIMPYDRKGATKDHVYLETCYLSYVGGMYRRSLHERFGYYDEGFTGAGDTEFKNRILPHIAVEFLPQTLGIFLNYPDERTTASPRVEIEDLRAWYIHRTLGGIRYAFERRPVAEAEALLAIAVGYRKSFCGHLSSDVEYAALLAHYIKDREPSSRIAGSVSADLDDLLTRLKSLEFAETMPGKMSCVGKLISDWRAAKRIQKAVRQASSATKGAYFSIINDNRLEQHSWLWKTTLD